MKVFAPALFFLTLLAPLLPAFGQCPPISEGSLPALKSLASIRRKTDSTPAPSASVVAAIRTPVDAPIVTPKAKPDGIDVTALTANVSVAKHKPLPTGGQQKFPGPISIEVPPPATTEDRLLEQDGKFILVGGSDSGLLEQGVFLARFNADGTLDTSFGHGGSIRVVLFIGSNIGNNDPPLAALTPDGKIVVARTISDMFPGDEPGSRVAVVRLDHNGLLDASFGNTGRVFKSIDNDFEVHAVAVQRDEKVLIAGDVTHQGSCEKQTCSSLATIVRYTPNGQPDASFGKKGLIQIRLLLGGGSSVVDSSFSTMAVQDNGLILAAGYAQTAPFSPVTSITQDKFFVAEFLPTGELNPSFGSGGTATIGFWGNAQIASASSLVVQDDGKIVVGGTAWYYQQSSGEVLVTDGAFAIARLTLGGDLDGSFGNDGKDVIDVNPVADPSPSRPLDELTKVVLDPAGEIYAIGIASGAVGSFDSAIDIVALNRDGTLNKGFGRGGLFTADTYFPSHIQLAYDALLTTGGRLIVSGSHWPSVNYPDAFVMWAYSVTANPDSTACQ